MNTLNVQQSKGQGIGVSISDTTKGQNCLMIIRRLVIQGKGYYSFSLLTKGRMYVVQEVLNETLGPIIYYTKATYFLNGTPKWDIFSSGLKSCPFQELAIENM